MRYIESINKGVNEMIEKIFKFLGCKTYYHISATWVKDISVVNYSCVLKVEPWLSSKSYEEMVEFIGKEGGIRPVITSITKL